MTDNLDAVKDFEAENSDEEIYSKVVRAGRRTYFFDVKATRGDDYYLTITESRKKTGRDGNPFYEKHKMHLYKEDFDKFTDGIEDVIAYVKRTKPDYFAGLENAKTEQSAADAPSIDEEFEKL